MPTKVSITSLAFGGKGVGRIGGKVVFVPFTAPGDEALVEITSEKKGFSEGILTSIISPSPIRTEPPCPVYGVCGGCSLQHIEYAHQVEWKQRILDETLKRIGKAAKIPFDEPVPSPKPYGYRSRARFHIEGIYWGFYEARSHRVVDVKTCPLLDPIINETYAGIREVFSKLDKRPPLCAIEIGLSEKDSRTVAAFHLTHGQPHAWTESLKNVRHLKGFEVWAGGGKNSKEKMISAEGDSRLLYSSGGLDLHAGISVFSQVNRQQNKVLVEKVLTYAGLTGAERVVDLFSGVGNLTLPLARLAREAVGVESRAEAVKEARENAAANNIRNARFFAADSADWLKQNMKTLEREGADVLVLDPPRGGEPEAASVLSGLKPGKIIYVSCSPPTLARDLFSLAGSGYRAFRAVHIDMFPQTFHIEAVLGLELV